MELKYKVEIRCLLNRKRTNIINADIIDAEIISKDCSICVVRKAYFRYKRDAKRYVHNVRYTYYKNNYIYMSFNEHIVIEKVENRVHKFTIDLFMR